MEIKGDRRGLRLIGQGYRSDALFIEDLKQTLESRSRFLGHAELTVEVHDLELTAPLFEAIAKTFMQFPQLTLRGIEQGDRKNLAWYAERDKMPRVAPPPKVIRRTLRSGQRVVHPGDIVVVGDVNPGASVIAGGDVMVFGWLRGTAYAGQPNDTQKGVYALRFEATQVRIGPLLAIGGDGISAANHPEKAWVENHQVVVRPWTDVHVPEVVSQSPRGWSDSASKAVPSS